VIHVYHFFFELKVNKDNQKVAKEEESVLEIIVKSKYLIHHFDILRMYPQIPQMRKP
jgi:hypothetical protein